MSYIGEKNRTRFSSMPVSPNSTLFSKRARNTGFVSLADFEDKDLVSGAMEYLIPTRLGLAKQTLEFRIE